MKDYLVKVEGITAMHGWGTLEIRAKNKQQAISRARVEIKSRGHNYKHDGPLTFKAEEAAPENQITAAQDAIFEAPRM